MESQPEIATNGGGAEDTGPSAARTTSVDSTSSAHSHESRVSSEPPSPSRLVALPSRNGSIRHVAMAEDDEDRPYLEGYLDKYASSLPYNWKKRYFELGYDNVLRYYTTEKSDPKRSEKGKVVMLGANVSGEHQNTPRKWFRPRDNAISICESKTRRVLNLSAPSAAAQSKWLRVLTEATHGIRVNSSPVSPIQSEASAADRTDVSSSSLASSQPLSPQQSVEQDSNTATPPPSTDANGSGTTASQVAPAASAPPPRPRPPRRPPRPTATSDTGDCDANGDDDPVNATSSDDAKRGDENGHAETTAPAPTTATRDTASNPLSSVFHVPPPPPADTLPPDDTDVGDGTLDTPNCADDENVNSPS
eukprot:m.212360 g.212360  ORF g.212360 m.212360 type:complete len:363 (+) comp26089_c0_seq1:234-1322(+)